MSKRQMPQNVNVEPLVKDSDFHIEVFSEAVWKRYEFKGGLDRDMVITDSRMSLQNAEVGVVRVDQHDNAWHTVNLKMTMEIKGNQIRSTADGNQLNGQFHRRLVNAGQGPR